MNIICINSWTYKMHGCNQDATDTLFMGVRIMQDNTIIRDWRYPFEVEIANGKLIFKKDKEEKIYKIADFDESLTELKDILYRCACGLYGNELYPKTVTYEVTAGDQSLFLIPVDVGEIKILDTNYYEVFIDAATADVGTDEFQWILQDGDIFFTVPIEDLTPGEDPYIITIKYFVKK